MDLKVCINVFFFSCIFFNAADSLQPCFGSLLYLLCSFQGFEDDGKDGFNVGDALAIHLHIASFLAGPFFAWLIVKGKYDTQSYADD